MANIINKRRAAIYYDGMKAVDLWGDNLDGWTIHSGEGQNKDTDYYKFIPTLYRAVQLRAYSVSSMPFELLKGKTVYDSSADWKNKVGFMPNPAVILQLVESALVIYGRAYLFRERNQAMTKKLWYHLPDRVTPKINYDTGQIEYFERPDKLGTPKKFATEDYIYFWLPDPMVELGPPINYPAQAAANACGVLMNIDLFADGFFKRGAIKAMLLTVKGIPSEAERSKLVEWWKRVIGGIKNAFGAQVINAEAVTPVVVGEGMKELENVTIGEDKRKDIAIAVGIPMSILFADAANYATSQQDELNFLNKTVIPDCEFVASIFNEQLFEPLGLHLNFLPETLDAMQEDETQRAAGLQQLVNSGIPLLMAMDLLGYELTDEQRAELEQAEAEKKQRAEDLAKQLQKKPDEPEKEEDEKEPDEQRPPEEDQAVTKALGAWKRFAVRMVKSGRPANEEFDNDIIPADMHEKVMGWLTNCQTADDVRDIFIKVNREASKPAEPDAPIEVTALLEGIKLGVEALKVSA